MVTTDTGESSRPGRGCRGLISRSESGLVSDTGINGDIKWRDNKWMEGGLLRISS